MATLDDVLAVVTEEEGKIDSVVALIAGLKEQLAEALAGTTLPPAVQAKVDALFAQATENSGKIVAAIEANQPPVEPPVEEPPVTPPAETPAPENPQAETA